jgi:hypothetical protein
MLTLLSSKAQVDSNRSAAKPVTYVNIVADSVAFSYMVCYLFGKHLVYSSPQGPRTLQICSSVYS